MDLILWRHAEAENGVPDMARALTQKGHKQADKMAKWLKTHLPEHTRILVSPARRTQQTASALGMEFITLDSIAPGASAHALIQAAGWPQGEGCVLIVGHQPTLGEVAGHILSGRDFGLSVKKGAIWWFSNRDREGSAYLLRTVMSPDML